MNVITFFSQNGVPVTGLTPKIDVWKLDGTHVVVDQDMTEIAGGGYYYAFTGYDDTLDYTIRSDGGVTLSGNDRYVYNSNEHGVELAAIQASANRILGLTQENQHIDQTVYVENNLTSARLRLYSDAISVGTDLNVTDTYTITATYTIAGMQTYSMTKV